MSGVALTKLPIVIISADAPKLFRGNDLEVDCQQMLEDVMLEDGYDLVGYSSFNAANVGERGALNQAKKVHASVVILYFLRNHS